MQLAAKAGAIGSRLRLHIRATDVTLAAAKPGETSALNIVEGQVHSMSESDGASATVAVNCGSEKLYARITKYSARTLGLAPGKTVYAIIKAMAVRQ